MVRRRLVSMILTLLLMVSTVFGLAVPTIEIGKDSQSLTITGKTKPGDDVNIIIQQEGKRYYLDTAKADENGDYTFNTKLPKNKTFEGILSSEGDKVVVQIDTTEEVTPPPTGNQYVTFSVDKLTIDKGYVVRPTEVKFTPGENVWDVFRRELDSRGIQYDYGYSEVYNSVYVESIDGDGEFDHGSGSGWMYNVNGIYPQYGPTLHKLRDGDVIQWRYTTNLGVDLGDEASGAIPGGGGVKPNGEITVPNEPQVNIVIPQEDKIFTIMLDQTHSLVEGLKVQIPKEAKKVFLNLENALKSLPAIEVSKEGVALSIAKGNKITGENKVLPLFNKGEVNDTLKNATTYIFTVNNKPVEFEKPVELVFSNVSNQAVAWMMGEELGEIPTYDTKEEAMVELGLDGVASYAYREDDKLVLITNTLKDIVLYEAKDEEVKVVTYKDFDKISKWAQKDVLRATELELVGGYEDGTFRPYNQVTRAEFSAILVRAIYGSEVKAEKEATFSDVKATDWFKPAVDLAYERGIVNGYGDTFRPNDTITREQMAVMLTRALGIEVSSSDTEIKDMDKIAEWARKDVLAAFEAGLIRGIDGEFKPADKVTREVAAVIAIRAYEWLEQTIEVATQTRVIKTIKPMEVGVSVGNHFLGVGSQAVLTPNPVLEKPVPKEVTKVLDATTAYLIKQVAQPQFGSIGGEWAIFGLARRGAEVPKNYFENYYKHIEEVVKVEDAKASRAWKTKVTEVQRAAIAVAAIGKNPQNVAGVDLIDYSFNKAKHMSDLPKDHQVLGGRQGLNELVFGLIAMDLKQTQAPADAQIDRDEIIHSIVHDYQTADGGFSLKKGSAHGEVDITGMTIQALAPYYGQEGYEKVKPAVDKALEYLSVRVQGGVTGEVDPFTGKPASVLDSSESITQTVVALCALGIDPAKDERFMKDGRTLIDYLLEYYIEGSGFEHILGQGVNQMATEQSYYALVAYERLLLGKSPIYDMMEVK